MSDRRAEKSMSPSNLREFDVLRTNKVDVVSSVLVSLVVMVGMAVAILLALYILANMTWGPEPLVLEPERVAGRGDNAAGFARDFDPPGAEEVEEITEPTLEQTLESVTQALSTIAASLDSLDAAMNAAPGKNGMGDSRPPGPEGEGDDIVPRHERWELKFTSRTQQAYATQLDFYGIELGLIGGGVSSVDYATNLSKTPQKRSGEGNAEKRLYFMSRQEGTLLQYDRQLLQKAGNNPSGRIVLKFLTAELEETLAQAEMRYAIEKRGKGIKVKEIAKTIFESRPKTSGGFEFVVIGQSYRTAAKTN